MEALKKQASKLREQVAKQQQAVLKQFSGRFGHDTGLIDESELQCHQNLQKLYNTTKAAKHLQRNIVRGVEGFIAASTKQMEIVKRLAEDCCKYGSEYQSFGFALARASLDFGTSHSLMEKERESLLRALGDQVFEPLRAMIMSAPLEDARLLTYRYERIRQDLESQTAEVLRRRLKSNEVGANAESAAKLQNAESKLSELQNTLSALGREATVAMVAVETQQQQTTFERLLAMVDAERAYHQNVADILEKLHHEMVRAKQSNGPFSQSTAAETNVRTQSVNEDPRPSKSDDLARNGPPNMYFVAEVIHPFDAQADGELSISVGDYVVVRQVAPNGWSEGECKGKAGWFPSAYIERRDKAPASKIIEPHLLLA
ncbi:SH3 domain-containing protein 2-like isoform X2 [Ananas comosus]|uniref:SH3 domain-containing protein 2 n=1 Tax=Ananas comosus TaxID=4615 RepID=A0A199V372_ANACO|nr:SH3 domain-containing protein 2-like isoform X2 [Ananas comosus]OAY71433.1 SH3 domain-containing protein 2 [Ananas comosus]